LVEYAVYDTKRQSKAPWRDVFPPTWSFICSMYRNLDKQHKLEIQRQLEEIESKERRK
jgi:hypothetical protein